MTWYHFICALVGQLSVSHETWTIEWTEQKNMTNLQLNALGDDDSLTQEDADSKIKWGFLFKIKRQGEIIILRVSFFSNRRIVSVYLKIPSKMRNGRQTMAGYTWELKELLRLAGPGNQVRREERSKIKLATVPGDGKYWTNKNIQKIKYHLVGSQAGQHPRWCCITEFITRSIDIVHFIVP